MSYIVDFCKGLLIGFCDIVPGVSGSTIAFLLGIYEKMLASLAACNKKNLTLLFRGKRHEFFQAISWRFILPLLCGMLFAISMSAKVIGFLMNHETYRIYLYAVFFGLVLSSCVIFLLQLVIKIRLLCRKIRTLAGIALCIGFIGATFCTMSVKDTRKGMFTVPFFAERFDPAFLETIKNKQPINIDVYNSQITQVSLSQLQALAGSRKVDMNTPIYNSREQKSVLVQDVLKNYIHSNILDMWVILCGVIAIVAMLLPGVSGSYMMHILGLYAPLLWSIADFVEGLLRGECHFGSLCFLANFCFGVCIGAICFSRLITSCLRYFHEITVALLIGFMLGSLRAVWPFWTYRYYFVPSGISNSLQLEQVAMVFPEAFDMVTMLACLFCGLGALFVAFLFVMRSNRVQNTVQQEV